MSSLRVKVLSEDPRESAPHWVTKTMRMRSPLPQSGHGNSESRQQPGKLLEVSLGSRKLRRYVLSRPKMRIKTWR
jgi:hypothetical protein